MKTVREKKRKNIYKLELFEEVILWNNGSVMEAIKRVPGGWLHLYTNPISATCTFIPFDNEFMDRT